MASKVAAELKDYDSAAKSIDETLNKMGLDYLDQIIIHCPPALDGVSGGEAVLCVTNSKLRHLLKGRMRHEEDKAD